MVDFAFREWAEDDSPHEVAVDLVDADTGEPWTRRDEGATGRPLHIGDGAFSGCAWFEGAVSSPPSRIGQLVVTPDALEWWGEVSRLAVHLAGGVDTADLPRWWQLRIAGDPTTWAISEGFRHAPDGIIGHLLLPSVDWGD